MKLPDTEQPYRDLVGHPKVVRVVGVSGGYSRDEACEEAVPANHGVMSKALQCPHEGLTRAERRGSSERGRWDAAIAEIAKAWRT